MALASHLEALMNGIFLLIVGLVWPRLNLPKRLLVKLLLVTLSLGMIVVCILIVSGLFRKAD